MHAINEAGVYKFILKPYNTNDLRITVKRALELRELTVERDSLQREVVRQEIALRELEYDATVYSNIGHKLLIFCI